MLAQLENTPGLEALRRQFWGEFKTKTNLSQLEGDVFALNIPRSPILDEEASHVSSGEEVYEEVEAGVEETQQNEGGGSQTENEEEEQEEGALAEN
jgi:hypothetical protein